MAVIAAVRAVFTRLRLGFWAFSVRVRLGARGCACRVVIGRRVRVAQLPKLRLSGERDGSVSIEIGDGVDLGRMLLIDLDAGRKSSLRIGAHSRFEHAVRIQLFGGEIELAAGCDVRDGVLLKVSAEAARLGVGERVRLGRHAALHCTDSIDLEDLVSLSERVTVIDSAHRVDGSDEWTMDQPLDTAPITVGRNAIVYSGAVILPGTVLGANCVVAANALVPNGDHKAGVVLVGNPARPVKRL